MEYYDEDSSLRGRNAAMEENLEDEEQEYDTRRQPINNYEAEYQEEEEEEEEEEEQEEDTQSKKRKKNVEPENAEKLISQLVEVIRTGTLSMMKELIEKGVNVSSKVCGCTPLMYAAFYGKKDMVDFLLNLGADVNEYNLSRVTALMWAVERGQHSIAQTLLENGAKVNTKDEKGLTALYKATKMGCIAMVKLLVEIGKADVNLQAGPEFDCSTALQEAAYNGHEEIVRYLIEHDADVNEKNSKGRTALVRAVFKSQFGIIKCLIDIADDVDIDIPDLSGRTALHWAAFFNSEKILQILIQNGSDINRKDSGGSTALDIAKFRKHTEAIKAFGT